MQHILDNPVWAALISGNKQLSFGDEVARYLPKEVSPFAGIRELTPEHFIHLYNMVPFGTPVAIFTNHKSLDTAPWKISKRIDGYQMLFKGTIEQVAHENKIVQLSEKHIPEMLALTKLTNPGPFLPRTIDFGVFEATSVDQMKNIFEVNVFGIVRTYQAVLPSMREHKAGLIINISSGFGLFTSPFVVPYQMTKFGVEALTEGVRYEVKQYGIETVSVLPGPFPTEIGGKVGFGPDKQEIVDAYGPEVQQSFDQFGGIMYGKIEEYKADPQEVADSILALINMKAGTRPFQTVVNRIGEGIEQEFVEARLPYKTKMMENMGWGSY